MTDVPRYGHAQVLGFSEDVEKACEKERANLIRMGVDPDKLAAQVRMLHDQTIALNAQQEALKRQLKATTAAYEESLQTLYVVSSGVLDTIMAAARKTSDAAKNLQRLRSRIRRPAKAVVPEEGTA